MPRSSTLENLPADAPIAGATDVVEAPTAEAAIAAVHDRLGPTARIVDARRVLRGGIGGFFAKEVVQLHAAPGACEPSAWPRDATAPTAEATPSPLDVGATPAAGPWDAVLRSEAGRGAAASTTPEPPTSSPVDRLLERADDVPDVIDFATFLRGQLTEETVADTGAATAASTTEPPARPCEPAPVSDGGAAWSVGTLLRLGLPVELVRSLRVDDPADDLAWTTALAEALRPSCRPLPAGPAVLLGPNAHLIGEVDGAPAARSDTWLRALRGGRWLHLVVGGEGWRAPLADEPLAASWARPEDLPDALRCAVELGLVLGYGPLGGRIRRARPLDVALAVRSLVDGR